MKISLVGSGKTGKRVENLARARGWEVVNIFNRNSPINSTLLAKTVTIDFSSPQAFKENYELLCRHSLALVIGTTGWEDIRVLVDKACQTYQCRAVYANNFALGMNIFFKLIAQAARWLVPYGYQAYLVEKHHQSKKDRPSGTALALQKILAKEGLFSEPQSIRCGEIVGNHEVGFESTYEHISCLHIAYNRDSFAAGALWAAEKILTVTEAGLYNFEDLLAL